MADENVQGDTGRDGDAKPQDRKQDQDTPTDRNPGQAPGVDTEESGAGYGNHGDVSQGEADDTTGH